MALHTDGRTTAGETAVLAFAEGPFAGIAVPFRQPDAQEYFLAYSAGNPRTVVHDLFLIVVREIKWCHVSYGF